MYSSYELTSLNKGRSCHISIAKNELETLSSWPKFIQCWGGITKKGRKYQVVFLSMERI